MTTHAESPASLANALHGARLPAELAELAVRDVVAALGLGILAALLLFLALRPMLSRRRSRVDEVAAELRELAGLPSDQRLFHQARLRATLIADPARYAPDWRAALYDPGADVDHAALDAEIMALAARSGR